MLRPPPECYNRMSRRGLSPLLRVRATGRWTHFRELQRSYVRPFEMGHNQAQEGRAGRQARQDLHPPDQGNHALRRARRRRSRTAIRVCARRSWRPRPRTCRRTTSSAPSSAAPVSCPAPLRGDHLRGLRPRRRRAVMVEALTDNRNRAVSEMRHAFSKNGGNLGRDGLGPLHVLEEGADRRPEGSGRRRQADEHRARKRWRRPDRRGRHVGDPDRPGRLRCGARCDSRRRRSRPSWPRSR